MLRSIPAAAFLAVILSVFGLAQSTQAPQFTISTVAGNGNLGFSGDGGPATSAALNTPIAAAGDAAGNVYIADKNNHRIRKVTRGGIITTIAGTGIAGFGGDGGPATNALLNQPERVWADSAGNVLFPDYNNHRIRRISNGIITTVAGNGQAGSCGDGGLAINACIGTPTDVIVDSNGNLFIAGGGSTNVIRKVDVNGIITTVAGNGSIGFSGDGGPATAAAFNDALSMAVAPNGDLYIVDQLNYRIRKVSNGIITTVAGTGKAGYVGDGIPAINAGLSLLGTIRFDASGILYIPDNANYVRAILTDGRIVTVSGNGSATDSGDGGPALNAAVQPNSIAMGALGEIYIGEGLNQKVRVLTPVAQIPAIKQGGIVSASAFGGFTSVSPGSWIEIYGSNLASNTRSWGDSDFTSVNAPTALDGTSVSIGGKAAFIDYISPGQVNALVPSDAPTGSQSVIVKTAVGTSAPFTLTVKALQPGLLAPASFAVGGTQYAVALLPDGTYVLPRGAISGIASRPAKPGETIVLYGVGFGPVTPSIPAGQLVQQSNALASGLQVSIGGMAATASYSGLAPNFTGLYQFNLLVPNVSAGNAPLTFSLGGVSGTQTLYIAVGN